MKPILFSVVMFMMPVLAIAGPHKPKDGNTARDYRDTVVTCMIASIGQGLKPLDAAQQCLEATDALWAAIYPPMRVYPLGAP